MYSSAVVAVLVFPSIVLAGCLAGLVRDGETEAVIRAIPGPTWAVNTLLWMILAVNAFILWRVVPAMWRSAKSLCLEQKTPVESRATDCR
jgi:hypothetical protein